MTKAKPEKGIERPCTTRAPSRRPSSTRWVGAYSNRRLGARDVGEGVPDVALPEWRVVRTGGPRRSHTATSERLSPIWWREIVERCLGAPQRRCRPFQQLPPGRARRGGSPGPHSRRSRSRDWVSPSPWIVGRRAAEKGGYPAGDHSRVGAGRVLPRAEHVEVAESYRLQSVVVEKGAGRTARLSSWRRRRATTVPRRAPQPSVVQDRRRRPSWTTRTRLARCRRHAPRQTR